MKKPTTAERAAAELIPLMFEMGRLVKQQLSSEGDGPSSYLHLATLRYVGEAGMPDMGAIAQYLRIAAPSATTIVNTLVNDELIKRSPDPQDRRRVMLALTKKGVRTLADAGKRREAAFARVIKPLSAHDRREMARLLTIITKR